MKLADEKILELVKGNQNLYSIVLSYNNDNNQYLDLINRINYTFDCNCLANNNRHENVKGRAILCHILRKKGLTLHSIGEIIGRHHTSVNHYLKHYVFDGENHLDFINLVAF